LIFMIENEEHFLIHRSGTAATDTASTTADEATAIAETGIRSTKSLDLPSTSCMDKATATTDIGMKRASSFGPPSMSGVDHMTAGSSSV
jgi:hypothetical protein